ncbi:MAG: integration host factor subunit beta [Desulfuromonadaceae bacterium]|nr:integration host factor subunit beta [Desulfuromonadaceae bacterium]
MTRSDLVEKLAIEKNISISVSEKIINEVFKGMADTLISGGRVEIRGFGSFEVREYDAYTARNPKTGVQIQVKPKRSPFFKTGKELKERILEGGK